jgi:hypothetical protein
MHIDWHSSILAQGIILFILRRCPVVGSLQAPLEHLEHVATVTGDVSEIVGDLSYVDEKHKSKGGCDVICAMGRTAPLHIYFPTLSDSRRMVTGRNEGLA